jgi:hypothetical protein
MNDEEVILKSFISEVNGYKKNPRQARHGFYAKNKTAK